MTIQSEISRMTPYSGNGSTTAFTYSFKITHESSLLVVLTSSAGVETPQTLTTHYTVSGVGDENGGTVTMVTPPASGETLQIILDPALTQLTDYGTGGAFQPESHENALDKLTNITKRLMDLLSRSLTLGDGEVDGSGSFDANSNRIRNLGDPTDGSDAATRSWVQTQITGGSGVDSIEFPTSYAGVYASASTLTVNSQPTDLLGNKILRAGRRVYVSGSALGDKVAAIESASEGASDTTLTLRFNDGSTLSSEAMTVYAAASSPDESGFPFLVNSGQGAVYAEGTQGGAYHGTVFTSTITPGTDQHFTLSAKVFTGTRTDVGSAPGSDHCAAGYFEAQRGAGSSDGIWALNPLVESYNLNGATIGIEVDVNNFSSDPGLSPAQDHIGILAVSGATSRGGTALSIARNGAHSNNEWNRGIHVKDTLQRGIEFGNCGNATGIFSDTVLKIKSLSDSTTPAAMQLLPFDDDNPSTEILFYATNAADSTVQTYMTKRGGWHIGEGISSSLAGMVNAKQDANGEDTITLQRATDTSPTGNFLRMVNAANSASLAKVGSDGRFYLAGPDSAASDGSLDASQLTFYLDESGNTVTVKAKYADGSTVRTGTIALS